MIFVHDTPTNRLLNMVLGGGSSVAEYTATGNPLIFQTDISSPLKSLLIPFTPQQEGTGDPSPENIRPILPWNGLTVFGGGKSVIQFVTTELKITTTTYNGYSGWCDQLTIEPAFIGKKVTYSVEIDATDSEGQTNAVAVWAYRKNGGWQYIGEKGNNIAMGTKGLSTVTVTLYSTIEWIAFGLNAQKGMICRNPMVELGQTATAYEPYHPITDTDIGFPSPVYGGTLDVVSGVLTVTHVCLEVSKQDFTLSGSGAMPYMQTAQAYTIQHKPKSRVDWVKARQTQKMDCAVIANPYSETTFGNYIGVCFYDTNLPTAVRISKDLYDSLQDGDSVSVCYEIEDPFDVQLTPTQITALIGNNTIWSDADGSMTATYLKKG